MVFKFLRAPSSEQQLESIEQLLLQMLADDRHSFDIATSALIGGASAELVGPDLRETDRRVNDAEREVRRQLVVHVSVHGSVDVPSVLAYMSVVKDVERIGDYAKNIYDLAAEGADFSEAPDRDQLGRYQIRVSELITESAQAFHEREEARSRELIAEVDQLQDEFDDLVSELARSDRPASEGVPRALYYRHSKRIVAHLSNLLSAVVMPLDQLDYYDEDAEDRA